MDFTIQKKFMIIISVMYYCMAMHSYAECSNCVCMYVKKKKGEFNL